MKLQLCLHPDVFLLDWGFWTSRINLPSQFNKSLSLVTLYHLPCQKQLMSSDGGLNVRLHLTAATPSRPVTLLSNSLHQPVPTPPSTLIIGDSIVRNVRVHRAHTLFPRCYSTGHSYPVVDRIVIHVGTNDIQK